MPGSKPARHGFRPSVTMQRGRRTCDVRLPAVPNARGAMNDGRRVAACRGRVPSWGKTGGVVGDERSVARPLSAERAPARRTRCPRSRPFSNRGRKKAPPASAQRGQPMSVETSWRRRIHLIDAGARPQPSISAIDLRGRADDCPPGAAYR
jgi:hypothetical protein